MTHEGGVRSEDTPIRIGVSACLLGQAVRWDGGHKHDVLLTTVFGPHVTFVPSCPEMEMGLGTPREPVRLVRDGVDGVRLVGVESTRDHTRAAVEFARGRAEAIASLGLAGYVLKKDSPSCGMERVRVDDASGVPARNGVGVFARTLMERYPLLPVEEDGRLHDADLRENFIVRVFAYRRLQDLFGGAWRIPDLAAFHAREKFLLLAHQPSADAEAGRIVARARERDRPAVADAYAGVVMRALARPATRGQHVNVLQHMFGYVSRRLDAATRAEALDAIAAYEAGAAVLLRPIAHVRYHARLHAVAELRDQVYLFPDLREWSMRFPLRRRLCDFASQST